jgi:hypothetical protein
MLPARLVAQMARAQRDAPIEPVEIVVVAQDYNSARSLMLPWARVVGIVAESSDEGAAFDGVPAVLGIDGLLSKIEDDALILIDGERGIVLVDPDGVALAAYQAERERIAPRRRFFLDYAHQPAVSLDGRPIRVLGSARNLDEVRQVLDSGADTLYISDSCPVLGPDVDDESHLDALLNFAEAAAGKPITLQWDVQTVAAASVLQAARRAELTLAVPLGDSEGAFAELQEYLQQTREELTAEDIDFADIRLAASIRAGAPIPEYLGSLFLSRVIVTDLPHTLDEELREWLQALDRATTALMIPLEAEAPGLPTSGLLELLAFGVDGIVVNPERVSEVKDAIRAANLSQIHSTIAVVGDRAAGDTVTSGAETEPA